MYGHGEDFNCKLSTNSLLSSNYEQTDCTCSLTVLRLYWNTPLQQYRKWTTTVPNTHHSATEYTHQQYQTRFPIVQYSSSVNVFDVFCTCKIRKWSHAMIADKICGCSHKSNNWYYYAGWCSWPSKDSRLEYILCHYYQYVCCWLACQNLKILT